MKVLVTGCNGFIGSNLLESLHGHHVIGIDKQRVRSLQPSFHIINDDINCIHSYSSLLTQTDIVYHLAASADIRRSYSNPSYDTHDNILGTISLLEEMRKSDINKLVFASSSAVYGIVEDANEDTPHRPINVYGASKSCNEAYIHAFCDLYGMKANIFRFAQVVGRNQHRGVAVDFVKNLKKDKEHLTILGNGEQRKSYIHVDDVIQALVSFPFSKFEAYNIANEDTITVNHVAHIVCNELGIIPIFHFTGGDRGWPGDTPYYSLNISKAKSMGWSPTLNSYDAIAKTVGWLNNVHMC